MLLAAVLSGHAGDAATASRVLRACDLGAVGDGLSDDGPALRRALAAAAASRGPVTVALEPRVYRLGPWPEHWYALVLRGASDVTIDGRGAELRVDPRNRVLFLDRCARVTARNLTVDYDPLPYTQGDVLSVNAPAGEFIFRLHDGYPEPPSQSWVEANGSPFDWRHGVFVSSGSRLFTHAWAAVAAVSPVEGAVRTYRIGVGPGGWDLASVHPGEYFAMRVLYHTREWKQDLFRQGTSTEDLGFFINGGPLANIRIASCTDCSIEGVTEYMAPDMGIHVFDSAGTRIVGVRQIRRPGTDRLMAGMSDGLHCKTNRSGPTVQDCRFEALADDSINISAHPYVVLEERGPRELLVQYGDIVWFDAPVREGDRLMAVDPRKAQLLGQATVTNVRFVRNQQRVLTLDHPIGAIRPASASSFDDATQLYLMPAGGFSVRGCAFRSQLKTAAVLRGAGVFEHNSVRDCAFGVQSVNSAQYREGPYPHDLLVRSSEFRNVMFGAIDVLCLAPEPHAPLGKGIAIEGNRVYQTDGDGIVLVGIESALVRDNRITMARRAAEQYRALKIEGCGSVAVEQLVVRDTRAGFAGPREARTTR